MRALLLLLALLLPACGFQPLYGEGLRPAERQLADVQIANIEGRTGQQLRLLLTDRFYGAHAQDPAPRYRLVVDLAIAKQELGIRRDDIATRARLLLMGTFRLESLSGTAPPFKGSERSAVSYNILIDPYATSAAEQNATERGIAQLADNITSRIALYLAGQDKLPSGSEAVGRN